MEGWSLLLTRHDKQRVEDGSLGAETHDIETLCGRSGLLVPVYSSSAMQFSSAQSSRQEEHWRRIAVKHFDRYHYVSASLYIQHSTYTTLALDMHEHVTIHTALSAPATTMLHITAPTQILFCSASN
jgi:hypothetical protein